MSAFPSYLLKSRHSVYYFRIAVPESLRKALGRREIRKSLSTKDRRTAIIRVGELLDKVNQLIIGSDKPCAVLRGSWEVASDADAGLEPAEATVAEPSVAVSQQLSRSPLISDVLDEYLRYQEREGVSAKTLQDKRGVVSLLIRIVGDIPIGQVTQGHSRQFKETALTLEPRNPSHKGAELAIARSSHRSISATTFNNYIKYLNTLWSYALQQGYVGKNPFGGMKLNIRKKASSYRAVFTEEDLHKLFGTPIHQSKRFKHSYQYWVPLLGAYTGARLNELCQLYLDDVMEVDGIWCIHIRAGKADQRLKNLTTERLVPIHPELMRLGLIEHVEQLRSRSESRLFPELRRHPSNGYGHYVTKWFSGFKRQFDLDETDGRKDFHSFRHSVANHLKQQGVQETLIAGLLGHKAGGITLGRYGKDYDPSVLEAAVKRLDFQLMG